jgi:MtN3 and saliva related transmembrane protein
MDVEDLTAIAAVCAGIVMGVAPLLQAERVHRRRHSDDVSVMWLIVLIVGGGVWLVRGLVTGDAPIIIANVVVIVSSIATLAVVMRYRGTGPASAD